MAFSKCFVLLLCCLFCTEALAWDGIVQRIEDGNTLTVSRKGRSSGPGVVLVFYGIQAPGLRQPYGREARDRLIQLIPPGTEVAVEPVGKAMSGYVSALVQIKGTSLNHLLVMEGLAWVDRQTCKAIFCRRWHIQEHQAIRERLGIWGLNVGTPPWQWGK